MLKVVMACDTSRWAMLKVSSLERFFPFTTVSCSTVTSLLSLMLNVVRSPMLRVCGL